MEVKALDLFLKQKRFDLIFNGQFFVDKWRRFVIGRIVYVPALPICLNSGEVTI